ncbi:hypothetical protein GWK47_051088 [Chionoecetes opilio]|uniref:Uncharacterized protein n=1 Tax=Chionoecetes opilio TaxID=41210 RepID=A0A8J5CCW1_CHIOP|nr:hypothetical protein GWK47_051088 [Chionoecetes opilio]
MLLQTITTHLHQHTGIEQDLRHLIERGIYMHDLCLNLSSVDKADARMQEIKNIFAATSMEFHKMRMKGTPLDNSKVIGMGWNTTTNRLPVVIPHHQSLLTTKSEFFSLLSKPFDPLGVLTLWLIGEKIPFQDTWNYPGNLSWVAELPQVLQAEIRRWWSDATCMDSNGANVKVIAI